MPDHPNQPVPPNPNQTTTPSPDFSTRSLPISSNHTRRRWYRPHEHHQPSDTKQSLRSSVPTAIPLPPGATGRPKQRHEPARTTKTAHKTVLFPEQSELSDDNEMLIEQSPPAVSGVSPKEVDELKRVSAWLVAESFDFSRLQDSLKGPEGKSTGHIGTLSGVELRRFDEVVYTPLIVPTLNTIPAEPGKEQNERGEAFIFEYGVAVLWGLSESAEQSALCNLSRFAMDIIDPSDRELEAFQYCAHTNSNPSASVNIADPRPPRIVNDVIYLRITSSMLLLTISHALAQSVKLTRFEAVVEATIMTTKDIPYALAATGTINMSRKAITKQIGELLITRINVNLVSNVLDAPEIFWSEPVFSPLYQAVRGYLEIGQRVDLLNQRCAVISDMLDLLREHANSMHAEYLEWIIIVLITIEIMLGLIEIAMAALAHISIR